MQIKIKENEDKTYSVIDSEGLVLNEPGKLRDAVLCAVNALDLDSRILSIVLEENGYVHDVVIVDEKPSCKLVRIGVGLSTTFVII